MPEERLFSVAASLGGRSWSLATVDEMAVRTMQRATGKSDLFSRLLALRGVTSEEVGAFLDPTLRGSFPDPSSFADMERAAELILECLLSGAPVTVFADYDVDGGTSAAILSRYFAAWGRPLGLYVPDRLTEGYGPSPAAFRALKAEGADLVITVDCGAAAREALEAAVEIELPVVVLDHHLMHGDIPPAAALVNPNRPDCPSGEGHLAGVGVVFILIAAINTLARKRGLVPPKGLPNPLQWLDLCALGTLCDMAPLIGVNRAFATQGLKVMSRDGNIGLRALADVAGIGRVETAYHATFMLGPRLNAGGRIGDPWLAARLLSTDDSNEAYALAERLHAINDDRKAIEAEILDQAIAQAERALSQDPDRCVLIARGEGWHPGVIGIVAGRLKDRFHLPAIVLGWGEGLGPVAKGSGRSVSGVNIGDAISAAAKAGFILSGGGHAMAGGLSLMPDQIPAFETWLDQRLRTQNDQVTAAKGLKVDAVLAAGAATLERLEEIELLGPFGAGAPRPIFAVQNATLTSIRRIGENHLKLHVDDGTGLLESVAWRQADTPLGEALHPGCKIHLAGTLQANEWNGRTRVQFELIDAALCAEESAVRA